MRVVEYQKDTSSLTYRVLNGTGLVACVFVAIVVGLMIANTVNLKWTDPIHSPALLKLLEDLKTEPNNAELRREIQELDLLARQAFFTSQEFNQNAIWMIVGGLVVMIAAFKSIEAYRWRFPYPDGRAPKDDIIENARWARKSVTYAGLVMLGFALILALPWKSPLDGGIEETDSTVAGEGTIAVVESVGGLREETRPAQVTPVPSGTPIFPSAAERLKYWPYFRGAGQGVAVASDAPLEWDGASGDGIVWAIELPNTGFSSPIIWEKKLFLTGASKEVREVYCVNRDDGKMLWVKRVEAIPGSPEEPPRVNSDTGYAAATMTTDGTQVYAIFSTGDIVALDLDGGQIWGQNLGVPDNPYGHSSSLAIHQDILLVQYDQEENGVFLGLDARTGEVRWKVARDLGASWSSPLLVNTGERMEVILAAEPAVVSYDPSSGKELWRREGLEGGEVAPTPVLADGLLYVAADYVKLEAVNLADQSVVWIAEDYVPGVSTPVVFGNLLFYGLSDGGFGCYQAKTGEELWHEESDEGFYASPVLFGDRDYLIDRGGVMHIFAAKDTYEPLGKPTLDEAAVTTPVVLDGDIYYRGIQHLYRIGS